MYQVRIDLWLVELLIPVFEVIEGKRHRNWHGKPRLIELLPIVDWLHGECEASRSVASLMYSAKIREYRRNIGKRYI
jgi:hypothetical protein